MDLTQQQRLLARLVTDAAFREGFLDGGLQSQQVRFFAHSLQRKRLNEVSKLLPHTRRALDDRFVELFLRYALTCLPQGLRKHQQDAVAFCAFLARQQALSPQVADLARYEAACIQAAGPGCRLLLRWLHHAPGGGPAVALWFRLHPQARLRHALIRLRLRRRASLL